MYRFLCLVVEFLDFVCFSEVQEATAASTALSTDVPAATHAPLGSNGPRVDCATALPTMVNVPSPVTVVTQSVSEIRGVVRDNQ